MRGPRIPQPKELRNIPRNGGTNSAPYALTSIMRQEMSIVGKTSKQLFGTPKEHSLIKKSKKS